MTEQEKAALRRGAPRGEARPLSGVPLDAPHRILQVVDRLAAATAYMSGALLLLASFYITAEVIGRQFFHASSGVTDEFGGYALVFGGIGALAFALATGAHVRIDVLLPHLPPWAQSVLNYAALAAMAIFACIVAFYSWKLAIDSFSIDARATSVLRTPLFVPQGFMALGFSLLGLQAVAIFGVGVSESLRLGRWAALEVLDASDLTEEL